MKAQMLEAALRNAQAVSTQWSESRACLKEQSKKLAKERRDVLKEQRAAERKRRRVRAKCASIPTDELVLELEYRTELKTMCQERRDAAAAAQVGR